MRKTIWGAAAATILCCALCALCEGLDLQAAGVAAAGIGAELHPSPNQLGNFFSASALGLSLGALIGGRLSDAVGRKSVLVGSTFWFGTFSLLTVLAGSLPSLVAMRFLTGLGFGGALPNLLALVAESVSEQRRNASLTLVYAMMPLGGAIASLISMLSAASQWRWIFVAGGLAPLAIVPLMLLRLRESAAFLQARARTAADGVAVAAEIQGDAARNAGTTKLAALFAHGHALRTLLVWVSLFLVVLTLYLLLSWLPTLLIAGGLSKTEAAGAQIGFNVGGALTALVLGYLLDGKARTPSITVVFVSLPLLVLALSRLPIALPITLVVVSLLGAAVVSAQAFLYATAPACYPTLIRGTGVGAAVAVGRVGSIVGPKLGGALQTAGHDPSQLLMDVLPLVVLGSVCALALASLMRRAGRV
jgi:AAHS family 3-hydroxyphenylpropionic acid transporter